jgi:hypothetical protein
VAAEAAEREIDILFFDFTAEGKSKCLFDKFWVFGTTKGA